MGNPVAVLKLKYVNEYRDRTGKMRRYFRRGSTRGPLPGDIGSVEFLAAYQGFLGDRPAERSAKLAGSLGLLITEFYASRAFRNLKPSSRQTYRAALEPIAKAHGHRTARITHRQAAKLIADIGETRPAMANLTKRVLQAVYKFAVKAGWVDANPIIGIDSFKGGTHHTWTEGELQAFEKRWPLGTRQRLAYTLLLYTMQRVGDVAKMNRADIVGDEHRHDLSAVAVALILALLALGEIQATAPGKIKWRALAVLLGLCPLAMAAFLLWHNHS